MAAAEGLARFHREAHDKYGRQFSNARGEVRNLDPLLREEVRHVRVTQPSHHRFRRRS